MHINKNIGRCVHCDYNTLDKENIHCPNCNEFNLNWNLKNVLSDEFCYRLERRFELAFVGFDDKEIRSFWCDGILSSLYDYKLMSSANIKTKKHLFLDIWTGASGYEKHKAELNFGKKSVFAILNEGGLMSCIPDSNETEWLEVDFENKLIEIYLK